MKTNYPDYWKITCQEPGVKFENNYRVYLKQNKITVFFFLVFFNVMKKVKYKKASKLNYDKFPFKWD